MARKLRENEATFYPNRGKAGQWIIKVQRDGTQKQFTSCKPGRKGKLEAERKADEWLEKGLTGKDPRVAAAYAEFVESKRKEGKSSAWPTKLESMGRIHILPYIEHKKVSALVQNDWKDIMDKAAKKKFRGKPLSKKTLEDIRGAITGFATYCDDAGYQIRPIKHLTIDPDAPVGERTILQPDGIKVLFAEDTIVNRGRKVFCWYINLWRLLLVTGLRRGEACGLQRDDRDGDRLHIRRSINGFDEITRGKTDTAKRTVYITPTITKVLNDQAALLRAAGIVSPWLFPDGDGHMSSPNNVYNSWDTYRRQHGIEPTLHELRHTYVSLMQDVIPETALKRMVGHTEKMDTFGTYGHEVDGVTEKAAQLAEGVLKDLI